MMSQPAGPPPPPAVNGYAFMPQPAIYNPQNAANLPQAIPHGIPQQHPQYPYPQPPQAYAHQMQPYMEDQRRSSLPPNFPPQGPAGAQGPPATRHSVSPPQPPAQQLPSPAHASHVTPAAADSSSDAEPAATAADSSPATGAAAAVCPGASGPKARARGCFPAASPAQHKRRHQEAAPAQTRQHLHPDR